MEQTKPVPRKRSNSSNTKANKKKTNHLDTQKKRKYKKETSSSTSSSEIVFNTNDDKIPRKIRKKTDAPNPPILMPKFDIVGQLVTEIVDNLNTLVLANTYSLDEFHTKILSIGYHPVSLIPVIYLYDCTENSGIMFSVDNGVIFLEKLTDIYQHIEAACTQFASFLRGESKAYQNKISFMVTENCVAHISLNGDRVELTFEQQHHQFAQQKSTINLKMDEFNVLVDLKQFLITIHKYNCNNAHIILNYFHQYIKRCKELNVNVLTSDMFFEPQGTDRGSPNFYRLFSEIPVLCKVALTSSLNNV